MSRETKDSGIGWVKEIPSDWQIIKNKFALDGSYSGGTPTATNKDFYDVNGTPFVTIGNISSQKEIVITKNALSAEGLADKNLRILTNGTIIYSMYASVGLVAELKIDATINQSLLALFFKQDVYDKDYYKYCLTAIREYAIQQTEGTTQINLNAEKVKNFVLLCPSIPEQKEISAYIDNAIANIDEAISRHRSIIEKLEEYRKAVITHAVTKGLNPEVEMLETGDKYFSTIPYDWELRRNKFVFRIKKDIAGRDGLTVLSITQKGIVPKDIESNEGQLAESYANYQLVETGDFAMNHMDLLTGWVDISKYSGVTSPDYRVFVLREPENHLAKYFLYVMQMCYLNRIFYSLGAGVSGFGRWRLQAPAFNNFKIPIPPKSKQIKIATYLDEKCAKVNEAIARQEEAIAKLEEYRKSVIYNAVTGKIDCRKGA